MVVNEKQHDLSPTNGRRIRMLHVILPDYRGPYAPHDFSDIEVRTADRKIADYLCQHASLLPWRGPRLLVLQILGREHNEAMERETERAYRDLFHSRSRVHWHECALQFPRAGAFVLIGLSILLASHYVSTSLMEHSLRETLSQAVQVGGWVAMWTAFAAVFFHAGDSLRRSLVFRNLARLPMQFEYIAKPTPQNPPVPIAVASRLARRGQVAP